MYKICEYCKNEFYKKIREGTERFKNRKYCSLICASKKNWRFFKYTENDKKNQKNILYDRHVIKTDKCWDWTGSRRKNGYGYFQVDEKKIPIHRFSWEIHLGEIPTELCVLHKCDNPICSNPDHLFLGNHLENRQDSVYKNRQAKGSKLPFAKLKEQDIPEIRNLRESGWSHNMIAKKYSVSRPTIARVLKFKTWKHVQI